MNIKSIYNKLRYGGIFDILQNQTNKIHELQKKNIELYNVIFEQNFGRMKEQSEYHGPMHELKGCKVLSTDESNKKFKKNLIEVAEFNGYNGATYYWYFDKSAKIIFPDINKKEEIKAEKFKPTVSTNGPAIMASKNINTPGKIMDKELLQ